MEALKELLFILSRHFVHMTMAKCPFTCQRQRQEQKEQKLGNILTIIIYCTHHACDLYVLYYVCKLCVTHVMLSEYDVENCPICTKKGADSLVTFWDVIM